MQQGGTETQGAFQRNATGVWSIKVEADDAAGEPQVWHIIKREDDCVSEEELCPEESPQDSTLSEGTAIHVNAGKSDGDGSFTPLQYPFVNCFNSTAGTQTEVVPSVSLLVKVERNIIANSCEPWQNVKTEPMDTDMLECEIGTDPAVLEETKCGISRAQTYSDNTQFGTSGVQIDSDKPQFGTSRIQIDSNKPQFGAHRVQIDSDKPQFGTYKSAHIDSTKSQFGTSACHIDSGFGTSRVQIDSDKPQFGTSISAHIDPTKSQVGRSTEHFDSAVAQFRRSAFDTNSFLPQCGTIAAHIDSVQQHFGKSTKPGNTSVTVVSKTSSCVGDLNLSDSRLTVSGCEKLTCVLDHNYASSGVADTSLLDSGSVKCGCNHHYSTGLCTGFSCGLCTAKCRSASALLSHFSGHLCEMPATCQRCGKVEKVETHSRTKAGDKAFVCEDCVQSLVDKYSWRRHTPMLPVEKIVTSRSEKPFARNNCRKSSCSRAALTRRQHKPAVSSVVQRRVLHEGKWLYRCETCRKTFNNLCHFNRHRRTHTGEKPFSCGACGKRFALRSTLTSHRRTHTGEKPYTCTTCGKSFSQRRGVIEHSRRHTGEKPYHCDSCGKRFAGYSGFKRHVRTHSRKKS